MAKTTKRPRDVVLTSLVLVTLMLSMTGEASVVATDPQSRPVRGSGDTPVTNALDPFHVLLPVVSYDTCTSAPAVASPFSIEIAALHQIEPPTGGGGFSGPGPLTGTLPDGAFTSLVDALQQSGAGWARLRIAWQAIQPNPPPAPYDLFWWYDERLELIAGTGVRMIAVVADAPGWAADRPCSPIYPSQIGAFVEFLQDLVNRYKEPPYNIKHWELFNEPDGTWANGSHGGLGCWADTSTDEDGRQFARTLAAAYWAIKDADPEATILMGGMAHDWFTEYGGPFDRYFPDDVMAHLGGWYVDAASLHYFPDFRNEWERWDPDSPERQSGVLPAPTCGDLFDGQGTAYEASGVDVYAKVTHFANRMQACFGFDKPIWVTELAEHGYAGLPHSLSRQARYVIQGYVRGLAAGVENVTWYALVTPNDSYEQGLLYDDWTPKPSYIAYRALTSQLTGYEYTATLDLRDGEGYLFRNPCGQEKTVAWGSGTLTFAPVWRLDVIDREGFLRTIYDGHGGDEDGVYNGAVKVQLTEEPVFIYVVE